MNCYTVFKRTGTHADTLAAIGAAAVLKDLEPHIVELEDRFEIRLERHLGAMDLMAVDPGFSYLERPVKSAANVRTAKTPRSRGRAPSQIREMPCASPSDTRLYTVLSRLKAYGGPNRLMTRFARMRREEWTRALWNSFEGRREFVFRSPLVQLFNPHSAKGYALLKPSGTRRSDKTKDRWAEPFHEWLRFRGYFEGCAGWFASRDLRLFCPIPGDVPYDRFATIVRLFRDLRLGGTGVKIDCRAVLGLTRLLIQATETYRPPRESLRGVWVTVYKDMGQAHTCISMEQLAIPDWFGFHTAVDAEIWLRALDEHDTIVRRLTDSHSDEFVLLKQYRRIFQARREESIPEFVDFLGNYGCLLFQKRSQDHWSLPQFTAPGVVPILQRDGNLRTILGNPGFQAVSAAIRSSTLGAQAARHYGKPDHREIRYGLLSEMRRAGESSRCDLLKRAYSFISVFNEEGMRRRSAGVRSAEIENREMEAFRALVEGLPAGVPLGSLLCGVAACLPGRAPAGNVRPQLPHAISA
jgi:hypothetical protein